MFRPSGNPNKALKELQRLQKLLDESEDNPWKCVDRVRRLLHMTHLHDLGDAAIRRAMVFLFYGEGEPTINLAEG
jgi:hypothetical protein